MLRSDEDAMFLLYHRLSKYTSSARVCSWINNQKDAVTFMHIPYRYML